MNIAITIIAVIGIIGLVVSNIGLMIVIHKLNILHKARDLRDYSENTEKPETNIQEGPTVVEVPAF